MAYYQPPVPLKQDKFNPAGYEDPAGGLTIAEANSRFLRFPTAQGTENFADINVGGEINITNTATSLALGYEALNALTTGVSNTAFGYRAGKLLTTSGSNTFIGRAAGEFMTSGSDNTFIGRGAGSAIALTTGSNITLIGEGAVSGFDGLSYASAIGSDAQVNTSNTIVLGRSSETVRFNTLKPLTDTSDLTIGSGSTGNITFNISETNPLRIGTSTAMVNFQSSWYFLGPAINKTLQNMLITEFYSAGAGLTKTYYRSPINFIPRFFTVRMEDIGAFTGTGVSVKFTVYKNAIPASILGDSGAITITNTSDILSGEFTSVASTDGNNDAIYIGLTLDYTTLTALNRNFFICFYGQQTP